MTIDEHTAQDVKATAAAVEGPFLERPPRPRTHDTSPRRTARTRGL